MFAFCSFADLNSRPQLLISPRTTLIFINRCWQQGITTTGVGHSKDTYLCLALCPCLLAAVSTDTVTLLHLHSIKRSRSTALVWVTASATSGEIRIRIWGYHQVQHMGTIFHPVQVYSSQTHLLAHTHLADIQSQEQSVERKTVSDGFTFTEIMGFL